MLLSTPQCSKLKRNNGTRGRCTLVRSWLSSKFTCHVYSITYPEIVPLSALIACNAMNWPWGDALSFSHRFHHWLMLYTLGQYIVNVQSSTTSDGFLTIFIFGIWQGVSLCFTPLEYVTKSYPWWRCGLVFGFKTLADFIEKVRRNNGHNENLFSD